MNKDDFMTAKEAVEHIMRTTGCDRKEAEHKLHEDLRSGKLVAYGTPVHDSGADRQAVFFGIHRDNQLRVLTANAPAWFVWDGNADGLEGMVRDSKATPLPLRLDLANHSPTGFECGYLGSGPAQLALAMLAMIDGDEIAVRHHQLLKERVVAGLSRDRNWLIQEPDVRAAMADVLEKID